MIEEGSALWQYMSATQRQLAADGQILIEDRDRHPNEKINDYSYLVFPFAKLYEGFLKRLFRDLGIINEHEYESAHFRLGKVLSPNLIRRLGHRSAYGAVSKRYGEELAETIWQTWKQGRNLVFHYFPHNVKRLNLKEAMELITMIVNTMRKAIDITHPAPRTIKAGLATDTTH